MGISTIIFSLRIRISLKEHKIRPPQRDNDVVCADIQNKSNLMVLFGDGDPDSELIQRTIDLGIILYYDQS